MRRRKKKETLYQERFVPPRVFDFYRLEDRVMLSGEGMDGDFEDPTPSIEADLALITHFIQLNDPPDGQAVAQSNELGKQSFGEPSANPKREETLADSVADSTIADSEEQQDSRSQEVIFIDRNVQDADLLIEELRSSSPHLVEWLVIEIDHQEDGIDLISEALQGLDGIDAIHILSHGDGEGIQLGNARLDNVSVAGYASSLASWADTLDTNADLLIYGCNLASTEAGQTLLESIGALCDCDVAASDDLTGAETLGGDWALEYAVGTIDTLEISSNQWVGILAAPVAVSDTYSVNEDETLDVVRITIAEGSQITSSFLDVKDVDVADVDGDGDMDVVAADFSSGSVFWYENDGSENFMEHVVTTNASGAHSTFVIDVDGDGDIDVLSASYSDNRIAWYENDGAENFTEHVITNTAGGALSVYAADVDGDGDMDVLSAAVSGDEIAWYENDGAENFTARVIANVNGAAGVFAIDVDGDGDLDVLSAGRVADTVAWHENDGSENFITHTIGNSNGPDSVVAIDMDKDGDIDVLSTSRYDDTLAWFENDGSENFTEHVISTSDDYTTSVEVADIDNDGDFDVVSNSHYDDSVSWYENDGSQNFTRYVLTTSAVDVFSVHIADLDGDGSLDILAASESTNPLPWFQTTLGVLGGDTDVDKDPLTAVLVAGPSNAASFTLNPDGSFDYTPVADFFGVDTFTYKANDGTSDSNVATVTLNVTNVNDAPVPSSIEGANLTYNENDGAVAITNSLVLVDAESDTTHIASATIQVTANFNSNTDLTFGEDILAFTDTGTITGSWDTVTGTMTLTGSDTLANYQAALRSVTFENTSDHPNALTRTVSFTVNDGTVDSVAGTRDIDLVADANVPVAAPIALNNSQAMLQAGGPAVGNLLTDDDGAGVDQDPYLDPMSLTAATVDVDGDNIQDSLTLGSPTAIIDNLSNPIGTLTLDANGDYTFAPDAGFVGLVPRITYTLSDGSLTDSAALDILVRAPGNPTDWALAGPTNAYENESAGYTLFSTLGAGTQSVDLSITDIGTTSADYADFNAAVAAAVADNPALTWNGTTLTVQNGYSMAYDTSSANFYDISGTGTLLSIDEDDYANIPIGFSFEFYGVSYTDLYVADAGVLTFTDGTDEYSNDSLDSPPDDLPTIAAFWGDLSLEDSAEYDPSRGAYYEVIGSPGSQQLIVQYHDVIPYSEDAGDGGTFQVVLSEGSNKIEIRYLDMVFDGDYDYGAESTVGISDGGSNYIQFLYESPLLVDNSNLSFTLPSNPYAEIHIDLGIVSDGVAEIDEDYQVSLSNPAGAGIVSGAATTTTTIVNRVPIAFDNLINPLEDTIASGNVITDDDGSGVDIDNDGDVITITSATVDIDGDSSPDALTLGVLTSITDSGSNPIGDLTLNANGAYTFDPAAHWNGPVPQVIYTLSDGLLSDTATLAITVASVNDVPVQSTLEGTNLAYTENDSPTAITNTLTIADPDDTNIESAVIQITGNYANGEDILAFIAIGPISGSWNAGTGTLTLSGSDTLANYQTALHSVTYANTSHQPSVLTRTVSFKVNDGDSDSNALTRDIDITSVNDAPIESTLEGANLAYTENDGAVAITNALTIADPDDTNIESAVIQITGNYANGEDVLAFSGMGPISGSWNTGTGTLTLTGSDTLANYEAALRNVTFENTSEDPSVLTRTVSFAVNDGDADSNILSRDIDITSVNDAPVIGTNTGVSLAEGDLGTVITSAMLNENDLDDVGTGLTYNVTTSVANGSLRLSGTALNVGDTFTQDDLDSGRITYDHDDSESINDGFGFLLADGGEDGTLPASGTFTITITPVNDHATTAIVDNDPDLNEIDENAIVGSLVGLTSLADDSDAGDTISYSLDDNDGGRFSVDPNTGVVRVAGALDREADGPSRTITVRATSSDGSFQTQAFTINLNDVNEFSVSLISDLDPATNTVTENAFNGTAVGFTATAFDTDTTNNTVSYSLDDDASGRFAIDPVSGSVTVLDGARLDYETDSFHDIVVRAASTDGSQQTATVRIAIDDENESPVLVTNLGASLDEGTTTTLDNSLLRALDQDDSGAGLAYTVTSSTLYGQLELSTAPGVPISSFTQGDIDAGNLRYVHPTNYSGPNTVTDSFSFILADGGEDGSTMVTGTFILTILPTNDLPVAVGESYSVFTANTLSVYSPGLLANDTDVNADPLVASLVVSPAHGTATIDANGHFTYSPSGGFVGTDQLSYQVFDGTGFSNTVQITIQVVGQSGVATPQSSVIDTIFEPDVSEPSEETDNLLDESGDFDIEKEVEALTENELTDNSSSTTDSGLSSESPLPLIGVATSTSPTPILVAGEVEESGRLNGIQKIDRRGGMEFTIADQTLSPDSKGFSTLEGLSLSSWASELSYQPIDQLLQHNVADAVPWSGSSNGSLGQQNVQETDYENVTVGIASVGTGVISVGYVLWSVRNGVLAVSLMGHSPVLKLIDPVGILATQKNLEGGKGEVLESLF